MGLPFDGVEAGVAGRYTTSFEPSQSLAGDKNCITTPLVYDAGFTIEMGTLISRAPGTTTVHPAVDGEELVGIAPHFIDTTTVAKSADVILEGVFNEAVLQLPATYTAGPDEAKFALRQIGLHLRKIGYSG